MIYSIFLGELRARAGASHEAYVRLATGGALTFIGKLGFILDNFLETLSACRLYVRSGDFPYGGVFVKERGAPIQGYTTGLSSPRWRTP